MLQRCAPLPGQRKAAQLAASRDGVNTNVKGEACCISARTAANYGEHAAAQQMPAWQECTSLLPFTAGIFDCQASASKRPASLAVMQDSLNPLLTMTHSDPYTQDGQIEDTNRITLPVVMPCMPNALSQHQAFLSVAQACSCPKHCLH